MKKIFLIMMMVLLSITGVYAELDDSKVVSISLVNQDPDPAIAGDIVEVRLGVENRGGVSAEDLVLEIVPEYPFAMVSGESETQEIGTIKSYQTGSDMKIVKFKLRVDKDATAGAYELKVKNHEKGSSVSTQRSLSIDVQNRESAEIVHIDKTLLIPGKQSSMKFTINNVGDAPLRDLTFNWQNEDKIILPVGSDNTKYIKYIDIGDSAELSYEVIADTNAEPGLYELDLHLKYRDPISSNETSMSTIAGIYVGGGTDFDVAYSESSAGQTSFSIANIGSNPSYSVSVSVPEQKGWKVSGANSVIIGNLNKGDYTVASFELQPSVKSSNSEEMTKEEMMKLRGNMQDSIKLQIDYTDTTGNRESVEKEVSLNPSSMSSLDSSSSPRAMREKKTNSFLNNKGILITLAIVVIGLLIYAKVKRKKLKNLFKKK